MAEHVVAHAPDQVGGRPRGRDAHRDVEALASGAHLEAVSHVVGARDPRVRFVGDEVSVEAADDTYGGALVRTEVDGAEALHRATNAPTDIACGQGVGVGELPTIHQPLGERQQLLGAFDVDLALAHGVLAYGIGVEVVRPGVAVAQQVEARLQRLHEADRTHREAVVRGAPSVVELQTLETSLRQAHRDRLGRCLVGHQHVREIQCDSKILAACLGDQRQDAPVDDNKVRARGSAGLYSMLTVRSWAWSATSP